MCPNCHDEVHADGDIIIEEWRNTTGGRQLFWRRKGEEPIVAEGAKPHVYGQSASGPDM